MNTREFKKILRDCQNAPLFELRRLLVGEMIGFGATRRVFDCKLSNKFVVKIQYVGGFHNAIEFEVWEAVGPAYWWSRWFAECIFISNDGKLLIQEKVDMERAYSEYPKKIPRFFTDIKYDNYGFVGNQLKCVDYSNVMAMLTGFLDKKFRSAHW